MTKKQREEVESIGRRFMADYAPGVVLALYAEPTAPPEGANLTEDRGMRTVYWRPQDGLTILLHELGHHHTQEPPGEVTPEIKRFFEEMWAWTWAERTARTENIFFDYAAADRAFATYVRSLGLCLEMKWRRG